MKPKDRIILLQRQLAVAVKALKDVRYDGAGYIEAERALDEIERIKIVQEGVKP